MYTEYYINTIDDKEIDIKNNIDNIIKYSIQNVVASYDQIKFIRKNYHNLNLGCFIDYPIANCDFDRRQDLITDAAKIGVNFINITIPFYQIVNRKYNKLREDIKKNFELCQKYNLDIRYILEYRKFDHQLLAKVCEILIECGIVVIYPSTGFFLDNIEDNIIACAYLNQKTGINTIINGNIWQKTQIDGLSKINPHGISSNQLYTFELINDKNKIP
jgi:deoxyribose-phosphate aldolase